MTTPITKQAVLYARVSTEEQASRDNSIPAQIVAIKRFALSNNIDITHKYIDEGKSAKTADRPQFQQMISDAKKKDKAFSIILVHKTDRFARNRSDSVIYKSLLKRECGVDVISITENFDDSPTGKLLEGMMEVIAEFHSLNLAQEVMKGMTQKASRAAYIGRTPFGYIMAQDTRKLVIYEDEARVVRLIFEMYSKGDSFATIKRSLNTGGIHTREGKLWDSSAIKRIIKNPVYTGQYSWNKVKRSNNTVKDSSEWVVIEDAHDAIIEKELFNNAQCMLKSKSFMKGQSVKSPYLLSSSLKCGHCGSNMIGERKKHVSGKVYSRYVCSKHLNHEMCFYNFVHKDEIEKLVFDDIREILKTGKIDIDRVVVTEPTSNKAEKEFLQSKLDHIQQKYQRQLMAYEAGVISLSELQDAKARVALEEKEIAEQFEQYEKKLVTANGCTQLIEVFSDIDQILALNDIKAIKLWLKDRIHSIEVFNKMEVVVNYNIVK